MNVRNDYNDFEKLKILNEFDLLKDRKFNLFPKLSYFHSQILSISSSYLNYVAVFTIALSLFY